MTRIGKGILILFSGDLRSYAGDVSYEFRQENNLFYLTGMGQPGLTLVLVPESISRREILFLPQRNPDQELWTGRMLSQEEASQKSGIKTVWRDSEFEPFLSAILNGRGYRSDGYLKNGEYPDFFSDLKRGEGQVFLWLERRSGLQGGMSKEFRFANQIRTRFLGVKIEDASPIFHELRLVKSPYELHQIRKAIDITVKAHRQSLKMIRPGVWEYEVEALIEYVFRRHNAFDWAFPSIVASGPNATVLHYQENQRRCQQGELLLIDVGAEYNHYAADITRTVPVSGRFTPPQEDIYRIVLEAQKTAISSVRPGSSLAEIHQVASQVIKDGLFHLGLVTDVSGDQYRVFSPHGTSHWVGMSVHDVGSEMEKFRPGMVLTVEPEVYIREDSLDRLVQRGLHQSDVEHIRPVLEKYSNIGVRLEDDLLVTESGCEVLSGEAPKAVEEIERLMAER